MEKREAEITRRTRETQIHLKLNVDGTGEYNINTGVGFLDHMLELFVRHSFMDLTLQAQGDVHVDFHHITEDVGICLGEAFERALSDKAGIRRFGSFSAPMCEAIAHVNLDISGRPYLIYNTPLDGGKVGEFDIELVEEFFHAFVNNSGITLHINVPYGSNCHHIIEAIFKATARAIDLAASFDERVSGVPSTKGVL
ncbi:TPA: imidazoleglycerol-phosphate dehydratase HisB [Candidatus Poribacteria bacterium]|nr:imidazoleglycerol-phosphate dehydratase HisB [Candidatus Poribacteria bacterium]